MKQGLGTIQQSIPNELFKGIQSIDLTSNLFHIRTVLALQWRRERAPVPRPPRPPAIPAQATALPQEQSAPRAPSPPRPKRPQGRHSSRGIEPRPQKTPVLLHLIHYRPRPIYLHNNYFTGLLRASTLRSPRNRTGCPRTATPAAASGPPPSTTSPSRPPGATSTSSSARKKTPVQENLREK